MFGEKIFKISYDKEKYKTVLKLKLFLITILCMVLLTGCDVKDEFPGETLVEETSTVSENLLQTETKSNAENVTAVTNETESEKVMTEIDMLMQQMTLRQKVGQLFIVRPDSLDMSQTKEQVSSADAAGAAMLTDAMTDTLKDYPVGGVVMFAKNITSPQQIITFNESLQNASDIPLFIAVDEEGGLVSRLANHKAFDLQKYESAAAVGAGNDVSAAWEMGSTIGSYLKKYGFNMDFAPDADVNTNPNNPVIGTRAFSSDANIAAQMAGAMADGLEEQEIIPVFKHFPGHGDTAEDSHKSIAVSYKTAEEMENCEWLPFEEAGSEDCIMVGHIAVPDINNDFTPATMSYKIVTEILKGQLDFQGLIITDSLSMQAVTNDYDSGEAALLALEAGCDLLLMPEDFPEAFDAVMDAVENGTISEQRLDESVRRILQFKQKYGILAY